MDHNLDDSLNLESDMGVDFEHSEDAVVSQADLVLEHGVHDEGIPMEFEHCDNQAMLMDTGNEEIIVTDFMGDQFSLQEYSVQSDQTTGLTTTVESNQQQMLSSQAEPLIDLAFQPQLLNAVKQESIPQQTFTVKTISPRTVANIKSGTLTAPREVAIAPKLPKLMPKTSKPIAPKPVSLIARMDNMKRVSLANLVQSSSTGKTVLAQIGKQLIMVPSGSQKIKLVSSSGSLPNVQYIKAENDQAQLIATKNASATNTKPVVTKLLTVQGQSDNEPAILTKLAPRFVSLQKPVPIALGNKVLLAAPSKTGVKFTKKQEIISLRPPAPKLMPAPALSALSNATKQKVIITPNSMQNVILKPSATATAKTMVQAAKETSEGHGSQLHQINIPGKGIQFFRVVSNSDKPGTKPVLALPSKTFMLSDGKGNLIQMSAEKIATSQPPSLVVSGTQNIAAKGTKPQQKLVRIAPTVTKTSQTTTSVRGSQSLLAPLSLEEDSKAELRQQLESVPELLADIKAPSPQTENSADGMEEETIQRQENHPLIVIPSNYENNSTLSDTTNALNESQRSTDSYSIEGDPVNIYQSPSTPVPSEPDIVANTELGLRPRKACNCTKSQCLKLYCDCFANGEFCNRCNCNNCHNNLENEELRQKAIRGCLDRNPNAFRPKIGKAKVGGPEIVRRHNKGCNCKRSGCLKNYCECYEAKIACSSICKCVGCRNVVDTVERVRRAAPPPPTDAHYRPLPLAAEKQPCSFMTMEVISAVCQCLVAAAGEAGAGGDPMRDVIDEFARCLQDIIGAAAHKPHGSA